MKRFLQIYQLIGFYLFFSSPFWAQIPVLGTGVDTNKVHLAGTFEIHYELKNISPNITVQFPDYAAITDENYEFVRQHIDTLPNENGAISYRQKVQFIALEEGEWKLPSFTFVAGQDTIRSEEIAVQVESIPIEDPTKLADIQNIRELEASWKDYLLESWIWLRDNPWVSLSLLFVLLIIVFYFFWRKYKSAKTARLSSVKKVILPPDVEALQLLEVLEQKQLWQTGNYKLYYTELSFILRNYLQRRYLIPALEETTDKILLYLKRTHFQHQQKERLRKLLSLSDLVKFAKEEPLAQENISALENVRLFVENSLEKENTDSQSLAEQKKKEYEG